MTNFGIGEWEMRNGKKAVVKCISPHDAYKLRGWAVFDDDVLGLTWEDNGAYFTNGSNYDLDLIGPWKEKETTMQNKYTVNIVSHPLPLFEPGWAVRTANGETAAVFDRQFKGMAERLMAVIPNISIHQIASMTEVTDND